MTSTEKWSNLCEYRKVVEFERVSGKGTIRGSIDKLSRRLPEKGRICVSSEKWYNPGEYRGKLEFVRVSKIWAGEYRKRVESV